MKLLAEMKIFLFHLIYFFRDLFIGLIFCDHQNTLKILKYLFFVSYVINLLIKNFKFYATAFTNALIKHGDSGKKYLVMIDLLFDMHCNYFFRHSLAKHLKHHL